MKKCPTLRIIQPDHKYYHECSHQMLALLENYSPDIRPYSIDECFMTWVPFKNGGETPESAANHIREHIRNTLGFTVNIGISTNKLLAKMASDLEKPDLVHTLFPEEVPQKMWPLPVCDLFHGRPFLCPYIRTPWHPYHRKNLAHTDLGHSDFPFKDSWSDHLGICQRSGIYADLTPDAISPRASVNRPPCLRMLLRRLPPEKFFWLWPNPSPVVFGKQDSVPAWSTWKSNTVIFPPFPIKCSF